MCPVIIHRDITNNNILLNFELEASISNFGTTKLLDPNSSNQTLIVRTYGYVALGELFFSYSTLHFHLLFEAVNHARLSK